MTLNGRTRVSELQQGPPALMKTLVSTGLFRAGDDPDVMLGELCWTFGFNPGILLTMLQSANVEEEPAPLDIAPYLAMPLGELVEHVERVHHTWLRDNLPRLVEMTRAVAAGNPDEERLSELHDEVQSLAGSGAAPALFGARPLPPGEPVTLLPDIARLRAATGFVPRIPPDRTIADALAYWCGQALAA